MKFKYATLTLLGATGLFFTSCTMHPRAESSRGAGGAAAVKTPAYPVQDLVQYANPMCGTADFPAPGGQNNTFPGAVAPFGMIQWSPDTTSRKPGGYKYTDKKISGFSVDHLSGAGCPYEQNFAIMPMLEAPVKSPGDNRLAFAVPFSHRHETASPGCYSVTLDDGIKVELTATTRSGFGRFTYPPGKTGAMTINAASSFRPVHASSIHIDPAARAVSGWCLGGHFCGKPDKTTVYFYGVFDRPFARHAIWSGNQLTPGGTDAKVENKTRAASGAVLTFDTSRNRTVLAKIAISYVSVANAKANLEAENPTSAFSSADFDKAVKSARAIWNTWLNKIQVSGGTLDEKKTFYSMVYHALLGPTVCSDANGDYMGYDGKPHNAGRRVQYANFSGWDVYRSECQLLGMLAPKEASDMAQSLLVDYQQGGTFPRWGVPNEDSGVMMGDPAAAMIADFYMFGATNFDAQAALAGLVKAATDPSVYAPRSGTYERDALADYLTLGYVPEHQKGGYGNVSMTLEYASADFALSRFAHALGDEVDSAILLKHAQNWRNLYNPKTGYIQMRRRDGSWAPGFMNHTNRYDGDTAYVEGTAGQYLWMVPFDLKGLADIMGGPQVAIKRLDAFFTKLDVGDRGPDSWMCWLGNEPNLNTPWIYCFLGQPYKTQSLVRRAMIELYSDTPAAYPGNDDLGEMSSWYIFSALGMYPELPGSDVLVLNSPLFPKAVLHLQSGDVTIIGKGAAYNAPYVRSLTVNGQSWNKPWIRYSDVSNGGTLAYDLGTLPNKEWGSDPADAPPSYSGGD